MKPWKKWSLRAKQIRKLLMAMSMRNSLLELKGEIFVNAFCSRTEMCERRLMIPPLPFCPTDLQQLERPETRRGLSSSSRSSLWSREFAELQTGVTEKMNLGPAFMSGREFEPLYTEGEQKRLLSDMGYGNWILQKRIV
mmetsp:Transcript_24887/g.81931  ORF Transcript_24887/g.81931 Transcript_24887/m.81931 type:complete len:139 (+) Transcript_24887:1111-1527(+)